MPKQPKVDLATAVHGAAQKTEQPERLSPRAGTKPGLRGESRQGKKGILIHVEPELRRELRRIAVNEDTTLQALGVEALRRLIEERQGRG